MVPTLLESTAFSPQSQFGYRIGGIQRRYFMFLQHRSQNIFHVGTLRSDYLLRQFEITTTLQINIIPCRALLSLDQMLLISHTTSCVMLTQSTDIVLIAPSNR